MSLFKANEWWQAQCGDDEGFDLHSLATGNIDNSPDGESKIVVGSMTGFVRVFCAPQKGYKLEDMMLEANIGAPILQLEIGQFTPDRRLTLAILQPRRFSLCGITAQGDNPQATTHFELQRIFDLDMDRPMASFAHGPFGGSTCDQVACLSMDGMLTVVDRGAIVVKRQLPNCLLPGPLLYVPTIDSFVTATSAFEVECYRFSSLVDGKADALPAFWRVIIGEPALEVAVARLTPSLAQGQIDIIVLGERTLFAMSETGQLRLQMRLDYPPQALTAFPLRDGRSGIIVASSTGALMVYHERRLMWSARTTTAPVSIRIDRFNRVPGVLVLLDAQGRLTIAYLGTAPSTTLAGTARVALSEQDYEAMDEETHKLMAVIRQASAGEAEARPEPLDVVKVRAQVPAALDAQRDQRRGPGGDDSGHGAGGGPQVTVRLFLTYTGAGAVTGATLHVEPPYPVRCAQRTVEVPTIRGGGAGTPVTVPVVLLASKEGLPGSNVMTVTVSYATAGGEPRTAVVDVALPLALFAVAVPAVKAAKFKLTLDTNRPPPVLTSLFEDALGPPIGSVTNVVTVQYWCGDTVTAIVSKSAGRYRLQSDNFEAMWLLAEDLCARLAAYFALEPQMPPEGPFRVTFSEVLPLDDFFSVIDAHFAARKQLSANAQALSQRAEQFRVVQKRLLVRYKDKTPLPLGPLNALLEGSFRDLQEAGVLVERTQREVRRGHARLQGAARLTVLLVQSRFGLSKENAEALRSYLCVGAEETQEIGWPELAEAAVTAALRGPLGKGNRDQTVPAPLAPLADTARLKRAIAQMVERISKGGSLVGAAGHAAAKAAAAPAGPMGSGLA